MTVLLRFRVPVIYFLPTVSRRWTLLFRRVYLTFWRLVPIIRLTVLLTLRLRWCRGRFLNRGQFRTGVGPRRQ